MKTLSELLHDNLCTPDLILHLADLLFFLFQLFVERVDFLFSIAQFLIELLNLLPQQVFFLIHEVYPNAELVAKNLR